jgi:hypothetical protein
MKLYTDTGFLSEQGRIVFNATLRKSIGTILASTDSPSEALVLGSLMQKAVGDMVSGYIADLNNKKV